MTTESRIPTPIRRTMDETARECGMSVGEMLSACSQTVFVVARTRCAHRLRSQGFSLPQIARWMGRHHTTILHYLRKKGPETRQVASTCACCG